MPRRAAAADEREPARADRLDTPPVRPIIQMRTTSRWCFGVVVIIAGAVAAAGAQSKTSLGDVLGRYLSADRTPLVSYRATRHLEAATRGNKMRASLDAMTTWDSTSGLHYTVLSEDGSDLIRRHVLVAALDAEQKAFTSGDAARAALTPDNYDFLAALDTPDDLTQLCVRPRRKHVTLIDGSLYVRHESGELVRVEGQLSARPSFWTRRVDIVRDYDLVAGVHVPVSMKSTAEVLIAGTSTFAMTYKYLEINGQPVKDAGASGAATPSRGR